MRSTLENIILTLISQLLRKELKDFLELEIIPLIGLQSKSDPLQLLTTKDVCVLLKSSMPSVRRAIASGDLKSIRLGNGKRAPIRVRRTDLELFIHNKTITNEKKTD